MQFRIENMTCGGCARSVTRAIQSVDPKAEVTADPGTHKVEITSAAPRERLAAALADSGSLAFAQTMDGMGHAKMGETGMMDHATMTPPELAVGPTAQAYAAGMGKMTGDMMVPYTGNADVDFVRGMIAHHEAAVAMAKVELHYGQDPKIRKIAQAVVATLQAWLAAKGR